MQQSILDRHGEENRIGKTWEEPKSGQLSATQCNYDIRRQKGKSSQLTTHAVLGTPCRLPLANSLIFPK